MPRGPLPNPQRRRRNAPTIPTTLLPAEGRKGPVPRPPKWIELGEAGSAWWKWAWKTPQSAAWSTGDLVVVARRASLEDRLVVRRQVDNLDVAELLGMDQDEATKQLEWLIRSIASIASGELQIAKEARELDDRLGLTPKALGQLRWSIQPTAETTEETQQPVASNVRRLKIADPHAVAGS